MIVLAAIPIQRDLREKIARLQGHVIFQKLLRPSHMELHITLKAPQEITDADKETWVQIAQDTCAGFGPLDLKITGLGFLTTTVLVLSIDPQPLQALHNALVVALGHYTLPEAGLHEDKRFHPHITIGRALVGPLDAPQRRFVLGNLSPIAPDDAFTASIVRLYGRDEGAYRPLLDLSLEA